MKRLTGALLSLAALAATLGVLRYTQHHDAAFDDDETPAANRPAPAAPAAPTAAPVPPATPVWTVDNIRSLQPVAPPHDDAVSRPIPALPQYDEVLLRLGKVVEARDGDPDNAWAIAHGVLARGPEFRLTNQLEAVPQLFSVFAEPRKVGDLTLVGFPPERNGEPVESHTDLILKNIGEVGVTPDQQFPMGGAMVTAADLYRYTVLKTWLVPAENKSSFKDPNDMPWGIQALAAWAPAGNLRWVAENGTPMDLDTLTDMMVVLLTRESKFMFDAMKAGEPFERKGQPLFSYTCGGAHLVQGTAYAVARGFGKPEDRKYVAMQGPLLLYRLPIELGIYDEALAQHKEFREKLLVQRMKFLGHWLETMSRLQILGLFTPDDLQLNQVEGAAQNLAVTVHDLEKQGTFDHLDALATADHQLYLDVIGDSAHAVRGLELALGRQKLRW